jgi:group I intron endonuclease
VKGIIYCAENMYNGKCYIGQTIQKLEDRKKSHVKNKPDYMFHKALKKYDNWNWYIVQEYEADNKKIMRSILNKAEIYYISAYDSFKSGYNMTEGGAGMLGLKHSDEAKRKISKSSKERTPWIRTQEYRDRVSEAKKGNKNFLGKKHTKEAKQKISEKNKGKTPSDEVREKISKANKGRTSYIMTDEIKEKIKQSRLGQKSYKRTEKHKRFSSELHKGRKRSQETCDKIGLSKTKHDIGDIWCRKGGGWFYKDESGKIINIPKYRYSEFNIWIK